MLFDGIFESLVNPPAAPISLAAMGAPRMTETFGAMKAILDSTYLRFINKCELVGVVPSCADQAIISMITNHFFKSKLCLLLTQIF